MRFSRGFKLINQHLTPGVEFLEINPTDTDVVGEPPQVNNDSDIGVGDIFIDIDCRDLTVWEVMIPNVEGTIDKVPRQA